MKFPLHTLENDWHLYFLHSIFGLLFIGNLSNRLRKKPNPQKFSCLMYVSKGEEFESVTKILSVPQDTFYVKWLQIKFRNLQEKSTLSNRAPIIKQNQ